MLRLLPGISFFLAYFYTSSPFTCIFFKTSPDFPLCWLWLTHGSCVGPQKKTGHPAGCRFPCWVPAEYKHDLWYDDLWNEWLGDTVTFVFSPDVILSGWLGSKHQLNNVSLCLQLIHFTSHHTTSQVFWAYGYSAGTQHGNLHPAGWPILFCGPTQEPCVSHSQQGRNRERVWKNAGEWTGGEEISKEEIPGSKRSMYGYILTYSRL